MGWGVELGNLQVLEIGIFLKAVLNFFFIIKVSPANSRTFNKCRSIRI